ncbi:MAG: hypothetical protein OK452_06310 [Thaumarchaeota archaeon]|nr:hypothetical protein [Nitrososphaerota archaeon]
MQAELLVVNGAVFSSLAIGLAIRLLRRTSDLQAGTVYTKLGATLTKRFADLPPGFTIREGVARARLSARGIDWVSLQGELDIYEAFRFGDGPRSTGDNDETLKLIRALGGR